MFDVADDLDSQRELMHKEILTFLEQEEDIRRAERVGSPEAVAAAAVAKNSGSTASSPRKAFRFPQAEDLSLPDSFPEDPVKYLSPFESRQTEHLTREHGGFSSLLGAPSIQLQASRLQHSQDGHPSVLDAIKALRGLSRATPLRGEQLGGDPRFCALISALDMGLRKEVMSLALGNRHREQKEDHLAAKHRELAPGESDASKRGVRIDDLCAAAHSVASLRVTSGVDGVLRSLALLGMGNASHFDLHEGTAFLLSLAAAASPSYQPIHKGLLRAFRKAWSEKFLAAVTASSEATRCSNRNTTPRGSDDSGVALGTSNRRVSGSSSELFAAGGVSRQLLLLLPLFAAHNALGQELPRCLEALVRSPLWAPAGAAIRPGEIAAIAAAAAMSEALCRDKQFWSQLMAAGRQLGSALGVAEILSFCTTLSQVGQDCGEILLARREMLQQQLCHLSSSDLYTATRLVGEGVRRHPKLQPLLSLLQQQLRQRASNS
ncbi:uncharacterized protein LOC34618221 [Cyclospora cayetanensis]|uniref:Uncharacterized protein LOC34618221 n=1 Tax=Cyclospora cayetanensis TaxID=88456 RepID=A0A6P6S2S1_9EIME|nr:uncharacterized protein LOC34618221 [Cyclospora cayetanensis]